MGFRGYHDQDGGRKARAPRPQRSAWAWRTPSA